MSSHSTATNCEWLFPPHARSVAMKWGGAVGIAVLAVVFLAASLGKLEAVFWPTTRHSVAHQGAVSVVHDKLHRFIPVRKAAFVALIGLAELGIGVGILAARRAKSVALASAGTALAIFTLVLVLSRNELSGHGCACVGSTFLNFTSLWANVLRNGVLMCLSYVMARQWARQP